MDLQFIWVVVKALVSTLFERKPSPPDPVAPSYCFYCRLFNSDSFCEIENYLNSVQGLEDMQIIPVNSTYVLVLVRYKPLP